MFKNGLRPEKAARMCFRTGVQLPSPPPNRKLLRRNSLRFFLTLATDSRNDDIIHPTEENNFKR